MMSGWKTWAAAIIIGSGAALNYLGYKEIADLLFGVGTATGLVGIGHKIEKNKW